MYTGTIEWTRALDGGAGKWLYLGTWDGAAAAGYLVKKERVYSGYRSAIRWALYRCARDEHGHRCWSRRPIAHYRTLGEAQSAPTARGHVYG